MAKDRPQWLTDLSKGFKRHRQGRTGWMVELHRDRLRVSSGELPPRTDEPEGRLIRRSVTLSTPPGPATFKAALEEACNLFDAVQAGTWRWPDPTAMPGAGDADRLSGAALKRLVDHFQTAVVGEKVSESTWRRMYAPYLALLVAGAEERRWGSDTELLQGVLRHWAPNSRARQMAHDRIRGAWRMAGWEWPEAISQLRGNGKAAADPEGVRAFNDEEIAELRARLQRSHRITPASLVAWDLLICFGLRPAELQGLELLEEGGMAVAQVRRIKRSSRGSCGPRMVPAVPPTGWPTDCHDLNKRWKLHGLPEGMVAARSPGQVLAQQLARLKQSKPVQIELPDELSPYGLRHAFALRLAQQLGLHVREAAELMGHSPQVHLSTYGRRLDQPKLLARVRAQVLKSTS